MRLLVKPGCCLLAALLVGAGAALPAAASSYPIAIQNMVNHNIKVEKRFPAPSGLTGWVVRQSGHYAIVFTTPDGKTALSGTLYDQNGDNLTAQYFNKYVPKPDFSSAYKALAKSTYIVEGTKAAPKSLLYIFTDANCPYCHATWMALRPYLKEGLQIRWIPVAILRRSSVGKAVAMLASKDPAAAFRNDMEHFGQSPSRPIHVTQAQRAKYLPELQANNSLMQRFGITGTPGIVWRKRDGHIGIKPGMPRLHEIPIMTGLPAVKNNNPGLARFK